MPCQMDWEVSELAPLQSENSLLFSAIAAMAYFV